MFRFSFSPFFYSQTSPQVSSVRTRRIMKENPLVCPVQKNRHLMSLYTPYRDGSLRVRQRRSPKSPDQYIRGGRSLTGVVDFESWELLLRSTCSSYNYKHVRRDCLDQTVSSNETIYIVLVISKCISCEVPGGRVPNPFLVSTKRVSERFLFVRLDETTEKRIWLPLYKVQ